MNREIFKQQLSELFAGQILNLIWTRSGSAEITIKKELTRLEIGHLFSLGMESIESSDESLLITFDLSKAMLNFQL